MTKRICPVCGMEFEPKPARPTQKFCSRACKCHDGSARQWQRRKAEIEKTRPVRPRQLVRADRSPRPCAFCGTVFAVDPKHLHARFCSRRCANRAKVAAFTPRVCAWCGKSFKPRAGKQRYCSASCRDGAKLVREKAARARKPAANSSFLNLNSSLSKIRAYLALPPAERYVRRGELTQAEHALAQKMYLENHSIRTVATNDLMH